MIVSGAGLGLMSTMTATDPLWKMCLFIGVFGAGIGLSMQILVLIVQNSFPHRLVGTATASSNFFRQVGATVGSAVVGSVFATRLHDLLVERLPAGAANAPVDANSLTPGTVQSLPEALRLPIIDSYNDALLPIFLVMVPLTVMALVLLLFVEEKPLATQIDNEDPRQEGGTPMGAGSSSHAHTP